MNDLMKFIGTLRKTDLGCSGCTRRGFKAWTLRRDEYGQVTIRAGYNGGTSRENVRTSRHRYQQWSERCIAVDLNHDDRTAETGDTLISLGHGDVQIKAIPNEGGFKTE